MTGIVSYCFAGRHRVPALITAMLLLCSFYGCDDKSTASPEKTGPGSYRIETEPSRSPDRNNIYYVAVDTLLAEGNGIYRTRTIKPIRERVLSGIGLQSPTVAFDNRTVAFLRSGRIWYYSPAADSQWPSVIDDSFASIVYVNDTLLVGDRYGELVLINESRATTAFFAEGADPTFVGPDTIVYIREADGVSFRIVKCGLDEPQGEVLYTISTLDTPGQPRWPTLLSYCGRLAYSLVSVRAAHVYAVTMGSKTAVQVALSAYCKAYVLDYNQIIYTGPDGRFYQTDFAGSYHFPYWYGETGE